MNGNGVLSYCATSVFISLILVSTTPNRLSNTFEVYAANNCDSTSLCENMPGGAGTINSQVNNCTNHSQCTNVVSRFADDNSQTNNCNSVPDEPISFKTIGCVNAVGAGERNTQTNDCNSIPNFIGCLSVAQGNDNTQTNDCEKVRSDGS